MEDNEIQYVKDMALKLSSIDSYGFGFANSKEINALSLINLSRLMEGYLQTAGEISETLKDISECLNDIRHMHKTKD